MSAQEQDLPGELSLGDFRLDRTLHLASGGYVRLAAEATIMVLNERDRRFVFGMIGLMNQYASDVGEDAFPPDV